MIMSWDYAELSKLAKENGGPEALVEKLVQSGIDQGIPKGKNSMMPIIIAAAGIALAAGAGITVGIQKLIGHFNKQKHSQEEIEKAKKEIIQGINAYDEMHTTETTDTSGNSIAQYSSKSKEE